MSQLVMLFVVCIFVAWNRMLALGCRIALVTSRKYFGMFILFVVVVNVVNIGGSCELLLQTLLPLCDGVHFSRCQGV